MHSLILVITQKGKELEMWTDSDEVLGAMEGIADYVADIDDENKQRCVEDAFESIMTNVRKSRKGNGFDVKLSPKKVEAFVAKWISNIQAEAKNLTLEKVKDTWSLATHLKTLVSDDFEVNVLNEYMGFRQSWQEFVLGCYRSGAKEIHVHEVYDYHF